MEALNTKNNLLPEQAWDLGEPVEEISPADAWKLAEAQKDEKVSPEKAWEMAEPVKEPVSRIKPALEKVARIGIAAPIETSLSLASSMLLYLPSKAYGLMALPFGEDVARMAEEEMASLAYRPVTDEAKASVELVGKMFELGLWPAHKAGQELKRLGFPRAGYVLEFAGELATFKLAHVLGVKAKEVIKKPEVPVRPQYPEYVERRPIEPEKPKIVPKVEPKVAPKIKRPKSLAEDVAAEGGLWDPTIPGEIKSITKGFYIKGGAVKFKQVPAILKEKTGKPVDEMMSILETERPYMFRDMDTFLELLEKDLRAIAEGKPENRVYRLDRVEISEKVFYDKLIEHERGRLRDEGYTDREIESLGERLEAKIEKPLIEEIAREQKRNAEEVSAFFQEIRTKRIEKELGAEVDKAIGDIEPPVGLSIKAIREAQPKEEVFKFTDPVTESRFKAAQGIKGETFWARIKETITSLKNKATREYEHLPKTKEFAQLRFDLLKLAKQKGVAKDRALRAIQGITINLNKQNYDVFTRKVILDDFLEMAKEKKPLPFGFTVESVIAESLKVGEAIKGNRAIVASLAKRGRMMDALKSDYIGAMKSIGFDVSERLSRKNYFRHQVLEYVTIKGLFGTGKKLRVPTGRGFLKKRRGSELDINTDYIQVEQEVMAQMLYDIEIARTLRTVDRQHNIIDKLKLEAKKQKKEDPDITWQDLIPDGYDVWKPREGNVFYLAESIPAKLAEQLTSGKLEILGIKGKDLRKVLAMGRERKQFVVKDEVATTLDNLTKQRSENVLLVAHRKTIRAWKIWQLISPRRYFKYNIRNLTGDADGAFAGNPAGFKKTPKAVNDLYEIYVSDRAMKGDVKDWFERGGVASTLQAQEMGQFKELRMFKSFLDKSKKKSFADIPADSWKRYWKVARLTTDFRESILRYANYLDYLEQMKKSLDGLPKNYGASIPAEIKGLGDIKDRAYWLSNDLLGAYDRISVVGQALREQAYPFWSWKEVNFKRYKQLFKNAASDKSLCQTVARKATGTLIKSPFKAYRIGKFLIKATAFWAALQVWNNTRYPDEEAELPQHVKRKPHIILGRDEEGNINYFSRLGALPDLLEWFDLDSAPHYIDQWSKGKMTLREIAKEMAKAPVNIGIQGGMPVVKIAGEIITRRSLFPDVFKPGTVRDRLFHIARSLGLESEYIALSDKPGRPYKKTIAKFFAYKVDPLEAAYRDILNEKMRFMKKLGKFGEGFWLSPRGNALYNARLALRYDDGEAAFEYMAKYLRMGGIVQGLEQSIRRMDPLAGMKDAEKLWFVSKMSKDERTKLVQAYKFYGELLIIKPKE